jgi:hypothetical protein
MRFRPETLGTLVRPRILATAAIVPVGSTFQFEFSWTKTRKSDRYDHFGAFSQKPHDLFSSLQLGDTSKDTTVAYVGEVTHYVVRIAGALTLVDKNNVQETLRMARKRLGVRTNLRVVSVGLKLYKGFQVDPETKQLKPINPWNPKTVEGHETMWFFNPWELVPLVEIIKYESVSKGDLILFQKTKGLVVRKKLLNKPRFYTTSSWSCYSVTLLNYTADGYTRFLPDRMFSIRRSGDPEPTEE